MERKPQNNLRLVERLQNWYLSNCNGEWEHAFGLSVSTIDNPGWRLEINTEKTRLSEKTFAPVEYNLDENYGKDNWYICKVEDKRFIGTGGPEMLTQRISIFLEWAEI